MPDTRLKVRHFSNAAPAEIGMNTEFAGGKPSLPVGTAEPGRVIQERTAPTEEARAPSALRPESKRYLPLDAYRGLIMILLVSNGFGFQELIHNPTYHAIAYQFEHHWVGGRGGVVFYDLIMPAFLFMVGVAMPYSFARRTELGATPRDRFKHVVVRCVHLIIISEIWVSIDEHRAHLEVHNVLFVVAVTYFICYFLMRLDWWKQAGVAAMLLVLHSAVYLLFPGPGGAFTQHLSAAARLDQFLGLARFNYPYLCVTLNLVAEIPSVLFGVWVGNLLRSGKPRAHQLEIMALGMFVAFGLGLGFSPLVPINKWLWTSTYTLDTTGWSILGLLILILLVDFAGIRRPMFPLVVVGMNPLFVYCLEPLSGWINNSLVLFTRGFKFIGTLAPVAQWCTVLLVMWYLAYWLYKRKIFLRA
jgi:heparan-alpha-glucosaminide N-acetyltransferase